MNSMLDPRIVAASTQFFEDSLGPEATATDVSTSLHGIGPQFIDQPSQRVGLHNLIDKLYRHRPAFTAQPTLFTRFALTHRTRKTSRRLKNERSKSDDPSLFPANRTAIFAPLRW